MADLSPNADPVIVRSSSLSGFADCPRRAASRLFTKMIEAMGYTLRPQTQGIGASVGSALHESVGAALKHKAAHGVLMGEDDSIELGILKLNELTAAGVQMDKTTGDLNTAEQQLIRMNRVYRVQVAPKVTPILVEERLEVDVPYTRNRIILTGQADVLVREENTIADLKGGTKMGAHMPQVGSYSVINRSHGYKVDRAIIQWVPRTSLKKPPADAVVKVYDLAAAETAAVNVIRHIDGDLTTFLEGDPARGIQPGDKWAFMSNASSMLCGERYCSCFGVTGSHAFCDDWQAKVLDREE